jgi:hypothetical protein
MRTFLGLLSILAFLGLVGFIALDRYFRWNDAEPVATWKTNERRAKLLERLDVEISAQRHRWLRQRAGMALLALLLSALFFSMHWLPSFRSAQTPDNQRDQPVASERGTLASVLDAAAVPWFGFASLLVIAGSCLILFGKGKVVAAGAFTVAAGLASHVYLIKELKIDKIFGVENKIDLEADVQAYLNGRDWSGVESWPPFVPFVKGERYLPDPIRKPDSASPEARDVYLARRFQSFCESFRLHHRSPSVVMVVGTTDRSPLRGDVMRTFESNFGLARARAEWVRAEWESWKREQGNALPKECRMDEARFLTLGSGPVSTPTWRPGSSDADPADDRQVDILAFWSDQSASGDKPSFGFHLGHEIELGKKERKESATKGNR